MKRIIYIFIIAGFCFTSCNDTESEEMRLFKAQYYKDHPKDTVKIPVPRPVTK